VFLIGLLQAQYVLLGYDASAHMTAETKQADKASPWGMINAILVSTVMGWIFLIAFFIGIHNYEATINTSTGFPITQILLDNFSRELTLFFMCLLLIAYWFCGLACVTTNSRVVYAFSRDHAMVIKQFFLEGILSIYRRMKFSYSLVLVGGIDFILVYHVH